MRKLYLALLPALLLALALGLTACGGGGESDEDAVVETIETSVLSTDPAVCKETQTEAFIEQTTGESGGAGVKACEKETEEEGSNDPDSVEVTEVEADGGKATADVEFKGGIFDGQILEVALVDEDGWKLDELIGFKKFNPDGFVASLAEGFEQEEQIDAQVAGCIVEGLEEAPDDELESLVLENNTQPIVELAESCE